MIWCPDQLDLGVHGWLRCSKSYNRISVFYIASIKHVYSSLRLTVMLCHSELGRIFFFPIFCYIDLIAQTILDENWIMIICCFLFRAALQQNWILLASLNHYFPVNLLWYNLYCIKCYRNKADMTPQNASKYYYVRLKLKLSQGIKCLVFFVFFLGIFSHLVSLVVFPVKSNQPLNMLINFLLCHI